MRAARGAAEHRPATPGSAPTSKREGGKPRAQPGGPRRPPKPAEPRARARRARSPRARTLPRRPHLRLLLGRGCFNFPFQRNPQGRKGALTPHSPASGVCPGAGGAAAPTGQSGPVPRGRGSVAAALAALTLCRRAPAGTGRGERDRYPSGGWKQHLGVKRGRRPRPSGSGERRARCGALHHMRGAAGPGRGLPAPEGSAAAGLGGFLPARHHHPLSASPGLIG